MAVTENILGIALRHADEAGATRVQSIQLKIGDLASIVDDSVQFYWDLLSKGTLCEGSVLEFTRIPSLIKCMDCHHEYGLKTGLSPCPKCGSIHIQVIRGEEFFVESITIEKE